MYFKIDVDVCASDDVERGQRKVIDYYNSMNGRYMYSIYLVHPSAVEYMKRIENTTLAIETLLTTKFIGTERREV